METKKNTEKPLSPKEELMDQLVRALEDNDQERFIQLTSSLKNIEKSG
jgi:uncharacterized protein YpiB (UPF0302 family)